MRVRGDDEFGYEIVGRFFCTLWALHTSSASIFLAAFTQENPTVCNFNRALPYSFLELNNRLP